MIKVIVLIRVLEFEGFGGDIKVGVGNYGDIWKGKNTTKDMFGGGGGH